MEAQLFLEVICGLACVIITLLMWMLFRTEKQNQEFRLRLGIMENDSVDDPEEKSLQLHIDEHKTTREILKSEMDRYFSDQWEKMIKSNSEMLSNLETVNGKLETVNGKLETVNGKLGTDNGKLETLNEKVVKIENNQEELFSNLSQTLIKDVGINLSDSFNQRQTSSDLMTEKSLLNLSATLTQKLSTTESKLETSLGSLSPLFTEQLNRSELKVERSLRNLSESFGEQLRSSGSKRAEELGSLHKTIHENHQQLSSSLVNLKEFLRPIRTRTSVEEVSANSGTIHFCVGGDSHLRRKIWVLQSEGGTSYRDMRFVMEENELGNDARLSIWGSAYTDGNQHVWSQSGWRTPRTNSGNVILVTLTMSPSAAEQPSFKLKFNTTRTDNSLVSTSEVVQGEGSHVVSFPPNNTNNFPPKSLFVAVIAPPSGRSAALTLKHLDLPGSPPRSCKSYVVVYFLEESSTGFHYKQLPATSLRRCGNAGDVSEPIGNTAIAIVRFFANGNGVGSGFRIEVD